MRVPRRARDDEEGDAGAVRNPRRADNPAPPVDPDGMLAMWGFPTMDVLNHMNVDLVATLLVKLPLAELRMLCSSSKHLKEACEKYKLRERFYANRVYCYWAQYRRWVYTALGGNGHGDLKQALFLAGPSGLTGPLQRGVLLTLNQQGTVMEWSSSDPGMAVWNVGRLAPLPANVGPIASIASRGGTAGTNHVWYAVSESGALYEWGPQVPMHRVEFSNGELVAQVVGVGDQLNNPGGTVALTSSGRVYAWGSNDDAALGLGQSGMYDLPVLVNTPPDDPVVQISCSLHERIPFGFAVLASGLVCGWGAINTNSARKVWTPEVMNFGNQHVVSVACGERYAFARHSDGTFGYWKPGAYKTRVRMPEFPGAVAIIPAAFVDLILDAQHGLHTRRRYVHDERFEDIGVWPLVSGRVPVQYVGVLPGGLCCITAPTATRFYHPIKAQLCDVCQKLEVEHFTFTPKHGVVAFCGTECYRAFYSLP